MLPPLLALLSWPVAVFALGRSLTGEKAFILAIMLGFLVLPEDTAFDLPLLPALTKYSLPALTVLIFLPLFRSGAVEKLSLVPKHWVVRLATLALIVGAFMTVATNGDAVVLGGGQVLPAIRLYDGFSEVLSAIILILPMLLARKLLPRPEHHVLLLKLVCILALGYSLLALYEVRFSPQLNRMFYGFFPHSWAQHLRGGGFRPLVFLSHGLVLSLFFCLSLLAAAGLILLDKSNRNFYIVSLIWLLVTLVLCKSLGALLIAIALLPVVLALPNRVMLVAAASIAFIVMVYPMVRSAGLVPVDKIEVLAGEINPQRAASLGTRLKNEDALLDHAHERPIFGWGGWGRSRVYDPETGRDVSITDGFWIIVLGVGGWVRYLATFGLLCAPIGLLLLRWRVDKIGLETAILAVLLAANLIDLIPNSGITPLTWIIAGAIWGRIEIGEIESVCVGEKTLSDGRHPIYRRRTQIPNPGLLPKMEVKNSKRGLSKTSKTESDKSSLYSRKRTNFKSRPPKHTDKEDS